MVVVSIASTATQTGITLSPSPASVIAGETIDLELDKVYDDGTSQPVFLSPDAPAQFTSSNTTLLIVNPDGSIQGLAPGQVTVTASYGGFSTQTNVTITAPGLGPQITSNGTASVVDGRAFSYQITGTNNPTSFGATGLPDGLSINTTTGLISGTPTVSGAFTVTTSAANASNQDTNTLLVTIIPTVSFSQWVAGYSITSGPTDILQGDGIPTLLKYLFDLDPTIPIRSHRPQFPFSGLFSQLDATLLPTKLPEEPIYERSIVFTGIPNPVITLFRNSLRSGAITIYDNGLRLLDLF
jgi:hypothetical protein